MPCRCDDYETNSSADKIHDLETRLCRSQSVVKDLWLALAEALGKDIKKISAPVASRAEREMSELAEHKAIEAKREQEELDCAERKIKSSKDELLKAEAQKRNLLLRQLKNSK